MHCSVLLSIKIHFRAENGCALIFAAESQKIHQNNMKHRLHVLKVFLEHEDCQRAVLEKMKDIAH